MKKIFFSFLAIMLLVFGSVLAKLENFSALSPEEFQKEMNKKGVVLIDIRTPDEVNLGSLKKGVKNLDYYSANFKSDLDDLDRNKEYLIYCRSGHRSGEAKKMMKNLGFKKVFDLAGGINAWRGEIFRPFSKKDIYEKYLGKPTVVLIAGTFCPHCQKEVPEIEKKIFNNLETDTNFLINVSDGETGARFETKIPQISDSKLNFEILTEEKCDYVPSWVVLDKNAKVIDKSCGNRKGIDGLKLAMEKAGIKIKKDLSKEKKQDIFVYLGIILLFLIGSFLIFRKK